MELNNQSTIEIDDLPNEVGSICKYMHVCMINKPKLHPQDAQKIIKPVGKMRYKLCKMTAKHFKFVFRLQEDLLAVQTYHCTQSSC